MQWQTCLNLKSTPVVARVLFQSQNMAHVYGGGLLIEEQYFHLILLKHGHNFKEIIVHIQCEAPAVRIINEFNSH